MNIKPPKQVNNSKNTKTTYDNNVLFNTAIIFNHTIVTTMSNNYNKLYYTIIIFTNALLATTPNDNNISYYAYVSAYVDNDNDS